MKEHVTDLVFSDYLRSSDESELLDQLKDQQKTELAAGRRLTLLEIAIEKRLLSPERVAAVRELAASGGSARRLKSAAAPADAAPAREDVRAAVSPVRCPYCHDGVNVEEDEWVACKACLARHHRACREEARKCAACGHDEIVVPAPPMGEGAGRAPRGLSVSRAVAAGVGTLLLGGGIAFAVWRGSPPPTPPRSALPEPEKDPKARAQELYRAGVKEANSGNYALAQKRLTRALELDPDHIDARVNRGIVRGYVNDVQGSIDDFDAVLKRDPKNLVALVDRATARHKLGDFDGENEDYERAIKVDPKHLLIYFNRGVARFQRNDMRGAIADFDRAIELDPSYHEAYKNRGRAHGSMGDDEAERADFEKALELAPDAPGAAELRLALANDYAGAAARVSKRESVGHARKLLARAFELAPGSPMLSFQSGVLYDDVKDWRHAIEEYDRTIEADPKNRGAHYNRGVDRVELGDDRGAIEDFTACIDLDPKDANALIQRAQARRRLDDPRGSIADCDAYIELLPDAPWGYRNRGCARLKLGEHELALADFDKEIAVAPSGEAYANRGNTLYILKRVREAGEALEKAVELDPTNSKVLSLRAQSRDVLGNYKGAADDWARMYALHPEDKAPLFNRAFALQKGKLWSDAIPAWTKLIEVDPGHRNAHMNRGVCRESAHDHTGAIQDYTAELERRGCSKEEQVLLYCNRAHSRSLLEDFEGAVQDIDHALAIAPGEPELLLQRGDLLHESGDNKAAVADYTRAIELRPSARAYNNRAVANLELEDWKSALADLQKVLELEPSFGDRDAVTKNIARLKKKLGVKDH